MLQKLFKLKKCEWFSQRYWYNTVSYSIHWSFDFKRNICSTLYVHCTLSMKFLNFSFFSTFFLPPRHFPQIFGRFSTWSILGPLRFNPDNFFWTMRFRNLRNCTFPPTLHRTELCKIIWYYNVVALHQPCTNIWLI